MAFMAVRRPSLEVRLDRGSAKRESACAPTRIWQAISRRRDFEPRVNHDPHNSQPSATAARPSFFGRAQTK
jgi:hypothetical protein